jgi:hypothetical protein
MTSRDGPLTGAIFLVLFGRNNREKDGLSYGPTSAWMAG